MAEIKLSEITPAILYEWGLTDEQSDSFWVTTVQIVDGNTKEKLWPKALELLGDYAHLVTFDMPFTECRTFVAIGQD